MTKSEKYECRGIWTVLTLITIIVLTTLMGGCGGSSGPDGIINQPNADLAGKWQGDLMHNGNHFGPIFLSITGNSNEYTYHYYHEEYPPAPTDGCRDIQILNTGENSYRIITGYGGEINFTLNGTDLLTGTTYHPQDGRIFTFEAYRTLETLSCP